MEFYEPFRVVVDLMNSADGVSFMLTKVSRDENNVLSHDDNYPVFSSVDEISKYLESRFDIRKDSEDDPEWYIAKRHENNTKTPSSYKWHIEWNQKKRYENIIKTSGIYFLSKRGTIWKCGIDKNDFKYEDVDECIGDEISVNNFLADYGDIIIFDRRPFHDVCHVLYGHDGCEEAGLYVEKGKLKIFPIEYHINDFEDIAFELRVAVQEDMSRLGEQENILLMIQQKYRSLGEDDDYNMLEDIICSVYGYERETGTEGMPIEMVEEEFLK